MGELQLAGLIAVCAGETALDVTEQLGLEQRLRQAGAIDRDIFGGAAGRLVVDVRCDDVFTDAAFAGQQDLRIACAARSACVMRSIVTLSAAIGCGVTSICACNCNGSHI